ncbi:MAG: hypothetical protein JWO33_626, partial [Caulobacteraceae bacterium]|nr:hypothetical protein [Caulobacteraceae bacterium]
ADWALRAKAQPLPAPYLVGAGLAAVAFNALPLLQESWACWRADSDA